MDDIGAKPWQREFCTTCGREVGPDGCFEHPEQARSAMVVASGPAVVEASTQPVRLHDATGYRAGVENHRRRRSRAWISVLAVAVAVVLVATALIQFREISAQGGRIDRLTAALTKQSGAASKTNQQLLTTTAELAAVQKGLGTVEGKQAQVLDTAAISARVLKSVFTVETSASIGSAFAFKADGAATLLITNFHVVAADYNAGVRSVLVHRGTETYPGTVDSVDTARDLAAIRVQLVVPPLAAAKGQPTVGEPVLVAGAPLGLGGSVTNGVVSAFRDGSIQFSAPISPGNSGGPVVDHNGDVIGVTEAKIEQVGVEGLGFAIPISEVCLKVLAC
jgi:S1-C subfamily serine protease